MNKRNIKFAFFGTPHLASVFLDEIERDEFVPSLVVTTPDRPQGRGLGISSPPVKIWASDRGIPTLQPDEFDTDTIRSIKAMGEFDAFVVIYYGKILPKEVFELPRRGTLNIHYSLLPRWRGTSPVRAAIAADDKEIGTTIMLLDEKIDHGPIVAQKKIEVGAWPPKAYEAERSATIESARLFSKILPGWIACDIEAREQNHDVATWCPKYTKEEARINLADDPYKNLLKIRAFDSTIGTYSLFERAGKELRVQIIDAHLQGAKLVIDVVKPEGKREMNYEEFLRSGATPLPR